MRLNTALPNPIFHLVNSENRDELQTSLVAQTVKNLPAMQETRVRFLDWGYSLEMEIAILSSILAWRISWTEEPGRLPSWGHKELDNTEWLRHLAGFWRCFKHHVLRIIPFNSFWSSSCFEPKCQLRLSLAIQMKRLEFHSVHREFFTFSNLWRECKGEGRCVPLRLFQLSLNLLLHLCKFDL